MGPQNATNKSTETQAWCQNLKKAVDQIPSRNTVRSYQKRVDWSVVGATTGLLLLLGGGVYLRVRTGGRRPRSTLIWLLVFVIILVAVLVNSRLRVHPTKREVRRYYETGCMSSKRRSCRACSDADDLFGTPRGTSPISRILYIATPLVFVFAAVAFFSIYRNNTPTRRRRGGNGYDGERGMSFGSPTPITVFSVAMPTRPTRATPTFTVKSVHEDENDDMTDPLCAICLTDIWSRPVGELSCGHRFHSHCVTDWLRKAPRPTCPLCKAIVGDEEEGAGNEPVV